jgi:sulfate adenylyltransferase subunit 1
MIANTLVNSRLHAIENLGTKSALRFITCGSVDDGKSTLIGRLLVDSRSVMLDQLANVSKSGEVDLAQFTDGLSAEREQGITIDVAYRYFSTPARKFIIGDAPGHVQYTRNMVTAASSADAAVVLVDATKLDWQNPALVLLPQTRRHSLLVNLLRVPGIVFAVNKLDAIDNPALGFAHIKAALEQFAREAGIAVAAIVPISALQGQNVVTATPGWCDYQGQSLLQILEQLPVTPAETGLPLSFSVQWVEKFSASSDTSQGRRIFWGKVASGTVRPGQQISILPSGLTATVASVLNHVREPGNVQAGHSAGIVLDREVDVSRGDWLLDAPALREEVVPSLGRAGASAAHEPNGPPFNITRELTATVAWLDDETLVAGRVYWALHGNRWVKAKIKRIVHKLNIDNLAEEDADHLEPNAIGHVELALQEPIATLPFASSRTLGALVLVDTATHKTSGAVLVQ